MPWVVEQAKNAATCDECRWLIEKGEWRFGKNGSKARWFHLKCGARGAPQMFPPFAKRVQELIGSAPDQSRPLTEVERAKVVKFNDDGLPVLADWLTQEGDPWGELITLRLAKKHEASVDHFHAHLDSLVGEMPTDDLQWRDGVVVEAAVSGKGAALKNDLDAVLTHRTAARLESLDVHSSAFDATLAKLLSQKAPTTLTHFSLRGSASGLEHLALPSLEWLSLELNADAMPALLHAKLPKLRALVLSSRKPLAIPFLEALVVSPLYAQLTHFEINEEHVIGGTISDPGIMVLANAKTSHLKVTWVELAGRNLTPEQRKQADKAFGKSNARYLKLKKREPKFDEFEFD
ncbi:MAG: hypothetical protein QM817_41360 [Archangium sp.]